jgi:hypothetical protein
MCPLQVDLVTTAHKQWVAQERAATMLMQQEQEDAYASSMGYGFEQSSSLPKDTKGGADQESFGVAEGSHDTSLRSPQHNGKGSPTKGSEWGATQGPRNRRCHKNKSTGQGLESQLGWDTVLRGVPGHVMAVERNEKAKSRPRIVEAGGSMAPEQQRTLLTPFPNFKARPATAGVASSNRDSLYQDSLVEKEQDKLRPEGQLVRNCCVFMFIKVLLFVASCCVMADASTIVSQPRIGMLASHLHTLAHVCVPTKKPSMPAHVPVSCMMPQLACFLQACR